MLWGCLSNAGLSCLSRKKKTIHPMTIGQMLQGNQIHLQDASTKRKKNVQINFFFCRVSWRSSGGASRHPSTLRATGCARGALECDPDSHFWGGVFVVVEWQEGFVFTFQENRSDPLFLFLFLFFYLVIYFLFHDPLLHQARHVPLADRCFPMTKFLDTLAFPNLVLQAFFFFLGLRS